MRLHGSGLEPLLLPNELPNAPVLVLGLPGAGKRTHVDAILIEREARAIIRSEDRGTLVRAELAREIATLAKTPSRGTLWISLDISTDYTQIVQNILLKSLEEYPSHLRLFLRGTPDTVLPTVLSRCAVYSLQLTHEQQVSAMLDAGADFDSATEAALARPGSVGQALQLVGSSDARERAKALLLAAQSRRLDEISAGLSNRWSPTCIAWLKLWVEDALLQQSTTAAQLASECGYDLLMRAYGYLQGVHNSKLAARAALTVLAER